MVSEARGRPWPRPFESARNSFCPASSPVSTPCMVRDVDTVEPERHLVKRHGASYAHLDQRVAAADVVRSVRKGQDFELIGCGCGVLYRSRDGERDEQGRENAHDYRHDSPQMGSSIA